MRGRLLTAAAGALLLGCVREPVEKPIVDLSALGHPAVPKKAAALDAASPFKRLYAAPVNASSQPEWLARLRDAREADRRAMHDEGVPDAYGSEALAWTRKSFVETPLLVHDRFFYDPGVRRYTVDRYLDDLKARYGGPDTVVLGWAYPNLGVDERNQFDLFRDLPGGARALRGVVDTLHQRGLRVLLTFHAWDEGTRAEGRSGEAAVAALLRETGADGLFGDAMVAPARTLPLAAEKLGLHAAIEAEAGFGDSLEGLLWSTMGWADWREYAHAPGIDRYRWAEPRFRTHVGAREARSHIDDFQYAWLNGAGFLAWENVFGQWNELVPRDAEALRRLAMVYHALPGFPSSPEWEPYAPLLGGAADVFASKWPLPDSGALWTIVNRGDHAFAGPLLDVANYHNQRFYDLWTGAELRPEEKLVNRFERHARLSIPVEAHGFGAVIEVNQPPGRDSPLFDLLPKLRERARRSPQLSSLPDTWQPARQQAVALVPTGKHITAPAGMVYVPAVTGWKFSVRGLELEDYEGADVQYPWESRPQVAHEARRDIPAFYLDRVPVTNLDFKHFIDDRDFRPADPHNFLRDWPGGKLTPALANKPVTWVSIEEARLYCRSLGKRLPHEWEWQYAAQGTDGRAYPWGKTWDQFRVPVVHAERNRRPGPDVGSYPAGASPFGLLDMVGLVWQWTDEFFDEHTRATVLKGGSYYQPAGAGLYFPTAPAEPEHPEHRGHHQVNVHAKYLLMDPSIDRAGTIGFRCAADAK